MPREEIHLTWVPRFLSMSILMLQTISWGALFHGPDNDNNLDTIYTSSVDLYSTKGRKICKLEETEAETAIVRKMIQNYYAAKLQIPMTP